MKGVSDASASRVAITENGELCHGRIVGEGSLASCGRGPGTEGGRADGRGYEGVCPSAIGEESNASSWFAGFL